MPKRRSQARKLEPQPSDLPSHDRAENEACPGPIRGLLHISGLPLTFVGIVLFSAKKGHGFFIFYILRAITLKTPLHPRRLGHPFWP